MSRLPTSGAGAAYLALLTSTATLFCCVLPAVLVSLGMGAAVVGLVSAVPQLVWLSEHKGLVFGVATLCLLVAGLVLWHARTLPCPADPALARACLRVRRINQAVYGFAALLFVLGAVFAFWPW